jgi:hypothetical protein
MNPSRIDDLERQIKRLQRVTIMVVVGFLLLLIWRLLPGPDTLEAKEFVMRDDSGAIRGALMMLDDGRPTLRLNDKNGSARAMLYLYPERGGGLRFTDTNSQHRLQLLLTREGSPELRIEGPDGRTRTQIGMTRSDQPSISIRDDSGRPVWASPLP